MRIVWGCLAVVLMVPLVGLFLLYKMPMWRDDARFDDFRGRVLAHPLPPETHRQSDSVATFGKISGGNGDYCEYRVRLELRTGLPLKELYAYYDKAAIAGVADDEAQVSLHVSEDTGDSRTVTVEFGDISYSDWDLRCT
ncbi:hypothetical protein [Nonomuraea aurantiaca]|uniref:hypothetical protein n=1 Tax=Nonomuraea aurantiaca TaxID=2878562 RepID=UPI001CDA46AB|nr:hypothetical protein [Nonomuraea aurantiaca]MCA2219893.1 hypothetical protein [Nonomuraea aurantiaca]